MPTINRNFFCSLVFISVYIGLAGLIIILSCVPPVSKDALIHHLVVPMLYLQNGSIYEIPFMDFSYYPMNLDLLYMIPLYWGNDIVPKFIHFSFALFTSGLIFYYLRRRINVCYGFLGALFFLSIPIIIKLSITVYVDLGVIFFSFVSLLLILRWAEKGFPIRLLLLSACSCGLAMGTKYNGLVVFFLLTLSVPFLYSRYNDGQKCLFLRAIAYGVVFSIISLSVFSPWMIRNYVWKGNPIYPLYNSFFASPNKTHTFQKTMPQEGKSGSEEDNTAKTNKGFFTYRSIIYKESSLEIALLPVRIFFQGNDGDPQYFDGRLNPFLFILPFFAFLRNKRDLNSNIRMEKWIFLIFAVLFFLFALFSSVLRIRYIAPIIPPLVMLSVYGMQNIVLFFQDIAKEKSIRDISTAVVVLIFLSLLAPNVLYIRDQYEYVSPFSYLTGELTRDEYIAKYRFEHPAIMYINEKLPADAKVLTIFLGRRGYYFKRDYIFDMNILGGLINRADRPEDIWEGLKSIGVSYTLIFFPIFEKWMTDNYSPEKQELTGQFFSEYTQPLLFENGVGVSKLKE